MLLRVRHDALHKCRVDEGKADLCRSKCAALMVNGKPLILQANCLEGEGGSRPPLAKPLELPMLQLTPGFFAHPKLALDVSHQTPTAIGDRNDNNNGDFDPLGHVADQLPGAWFGKEMVPEEASQYHVDAG